MKETNGSFAQSILVEQEHSISTSENLLNDGQAIVSIISVLENPNQQARTTTTIAGLEQ